MRTPASIKGHPIHAMLIVFPVGLLIFSLICDLIHAFVDSSPNWQTVALYTMAGGFIGALVAAVPGLIDLLSLPNGIRKIALTHMALNLTVVVLYAINLWLRAQGTGSPALPLWLSVIAVAILGVSGWLGAEMVHRHGVGVDVETSTEPR